MNAERQLVWGIRYIDDLVLRDRDTTGGGTLNERLYALQDPNWNVVGLSGSSGNIQERYSYDAYGMPTFLMAAFGSRSSSSYAWETLYVGYRHDADTGMYLVRHRILDPRTGTWGQRDPIGYAAKVSSLYLYARAIPVRLVDPSGMIAGDGQFAECAGKWIALPIKTSILDPAKNTFAGDLAVANDVWEQCCIKFTPRGQAFCAENLTKRTLGKDYEYLYQREPGAPTDQQKALEELMTAPREVIQIFYVPHVILNISGEGLTFPPFPIHGVTVTNPKGGRDPVVISGSNDENQAPPPTLAHELGHSLGLLHTPPDDPRFAENIMQNAGPSVKGALRLTEAQCNLARAGAGDTTPLR